MSDDARDPSTEALFEQMQGLFGDLFGGGPSHPSGKPVDLRVPLTIRRFELGGQKEVVVERFHGCSSCDARGSGSQVCARCDGTGQSQQQQGAFTLRAACTACGGRGTKDVCSVCHGKGGETRTESFTVTIPAGVRTGQTLRLSERGHGIGGRTGHLYLPLEVENDIGPAPASRLDAFPDERPHWIARVPVMSWLALIVVVTCVAVLLVSMR